MTTGNQREGEASAEPSSTPNGADEPSLDDASRLPRRKHPAHWVYFPVSRPPIVFLTVCTKNRMPWLAAEDVHALLVDVWQNARAWLVGRYILMPDHVHLFAAPGELDIPFDNWVKYWKSQFTKRRKRRDQAWQADHWDRRLRSDENYDGAWEYVVYNSVRAGLVRRPEDWPFQGELSELRWD